MTESQPISTADESTAPTARSRLDDIAALLKRGDSSPEVSVRSFLRWFGARRRGYYIVRSIRSELRIAGLITKPDFEAVFIDAPIRFVLAANIVQAEGTAISYGSAVAHATLVEAPVVSIGVGDPTYRLTKLAAANKPLAFVAPDAIVSDATTVMLANDYSQLPVMTGERSLKGVISWRALAARWALNKDGRVVRDFMEDPIEISGDQSLFAAIPLIADHGYVLVYDATSRYTGIVTSTDLSLQFQLLAEPFLLLGEIENQIRRLMDGKFTKEELQKAKDPSDVARTIENVADMTFGEYIRLLQQPSAWGKLRLALTGPTFLGELEAVRTIRNDVMHFDPDGVPEEDLSTLRRVSKFLRTLQSLGV